MAVLKKVETGAKNAGRKIGEVAKRVVAAEKNAAKSAKKLATTAKKKAGETAKNMASVGKNMEKSAIFFWAAPHFLRSHSFAAFGRDRPSAHFSPHLRPAFFRLSQLF